MFQYPHPYQNPNSYGEENDSADSSSNLNNGKVKHPPSAFLLFCKDTRDCIRQRCPNLTPVDVTRLLSQLWKSLEPTKKQKYIQKRQVMIDKFKVDHPDYNGETSLKLRKLKKKQKQEQQSDYPMINPTPLLNTAKTSQADLNDFLSHFPKSKIEENGK